MADEMVTLDIGGDEPIVEEAGFELTVDDNPVVEPEVDYEAQLADLKAEKEALTQKADLSQAFAGFAEQLKGQNTPVSPSPTVAANGPQQVTMDWAALEAQVNEANFKNPFKAMMSAVGPAFQQLQNNQAFELAEVRKENSLIGSKLELSGSSELAPVYGKYKDEVEAKVKVSGSYVEAAQAVRMEHMDDIVAEKVAEALKAQQEAQPATVIPSPTGFTNSGSMGSAVAKARVSNKPVVSTKVYEQMKQKAMDWAMNPDDPDDMEYVYGEFKTAGIIK